MMHLQKEAVLVQSKSQTVMDTVRPMSQLPKPRMSEPKYFQIGGKATKLLADGPPTQFELPEEEKVIPSEPNVIKKPNFNTFPIPVPDEPISSEPDFDTGAQEFPGPGMKMQDFIFTTPVIDPREVFPRDPDMGIMRPPPGMSSLPKSFQDRFNKNMQGGIMGANTQTGIDGIPEKYDI